MNESPLKLTRNLHHFFRSGCCWRGWTNVNKISSLFSEVEPGDAGSTEGPAGEMPGEAGDAATAAARDIVDTDSVKPVRRRGRQNVKSGAADADVASKPALDPLSPAQLAEAVQDKAVAS